ncbi:MAG: hypothetical protein KF744_01530 [Taibaiella sp.]|nr:hypothetical protein [Taibaiella sp.]
MEKKKTMSFTLSIVAIIVGVALYRQINFKTMQVDKPALALVYGVTFVVSIYILMRGSKNKAG